MRGAGGVRWSARGKFGLPTNVKCRNECTQVFKISASKFKSVSKFNAVLISTDQ